jgi:hypothetical protein
MLSTLYTSRHNIRRAARWQSLLQQGAAVGIDLVTQYHGKGMIDRCQ